MMLGEILGSAGDDGNVLLWVPAENGVIQAFGDDGQEDVESWRVKTMCRSNSGSEIYDLAWSPDGVFFITGSMDNVARIYNASNGMNPTKMSRREFVLTPLQVRRSARSQSTTTMCRAWLGIH